MKNNYTKLLPLAFSAVLFFTGCAAQQTEAYAANAASSKVISSQAAGTGSGKSSNQAAGAGQGSPAVEYYNFRKMGNSPEYIASGRRYNHENHCF